MIIICYKKLLIWKISQIYRKIPVLESLFYKDVCLWPVTLLKNTSAQVFSCKFCEIVTNAFFTEHLWTTASAIPHKYRHINAFGNQHFFKHLIEELLLLILCWSFKSTWTLYRRFFFNQPETIFKKGLWHSCFLYIMRILRTTAPE